MSTHLTSRTTLEDLIFLIDNANIPKAKKQDLRSALRAVGKVIGANLAEIPADPGVLRRRLDLVAPEAHGYSRRRWGNIRSLLARALELARPVMPSRLREEILAVWQNLLLKLGRSSQERVKPLLRYLSQAEIEPSTLKLENLLAYRDAILNDRLRARAEKSWDSLTWLWNKCVRQTPGWPEIEIPRESQREIYILPWEAFPPSFKADVDAYIHCQSGRILSEKNPAKLWRPTSCKTRSYQLRVSASALAIRGTPAENITSIASLVEFDNFIEILRFFHERHDSRTSVQLSNIAICLKYAAQHWVGLDDAAMERIKRQVSKLIERRQGMTVKNRERLRPLDDPKMVDAFLDIPDRIRRDINKQRGSARSKAICAQIAVAIAILQTTPIRIKNLSEIDIRKNLISRGNRLFLSIDGSQVKNGENIDFELPAFVVELLAWYIKEWRGLLLKDQTNALFPGINGGPKSSATLGGQISKMVFRLTEMEFNPHLFRHAGGKLFLDMQPGQYAVVQRVLGHRSINTTTSVYAGAETRAAGQHFADVITQRRQARGGRS